MPGSDDQYDQVHTYSQDHAGKSKTTKPAVREIGRDGAPVQLYVGQDVDAAALRTPPSGVRYLFFDQNGNLQQKNPDGTVASIGKSTEAVQDDVGAMVGNALTYDDAAPSLDVDESAVTLSNLDGYPVGTGDLGFDTATQTELDTHAGDVNAHRTDENIQDTVGGILNEPLDYDDATPAVDVSTNTNRLAVSGGDLDVVDEGIQDIVGGMAGSNLTYDDANNQLDASGAQNVPGWQEDANSPWSVTDATSLSATLGDTFGSWAFFLDVTDTAASPAEVNVTVNGETDPEYAYHQLDGGTSGGVSSVPIGYVRGDRRGIGWFGASGRGTQELSLTDLPALAVATLTNQAPLADGVAWCDAVGAPLNSLTINRGAAADMVLHAYGIDA